MYHNILKDNILSNDENIIKFAEDLKKNKYAYIFTSNL